MIVPIIESEVFVTPEYKQYWTQITLYTPKPSIIYLQSTSTIYELYDNDIMCVLANSYKSDIVRLRLLYVLSVFHKQRNCVEKLIVVDVLDDSISFIYIFLFFILSKEEFKYNCDRVIDSIRGKLKCTVV